MLVSFFLMKRRPPRATPLYSSAASDVYKRQVLHPMGFDSFGLPAEQFAIQTGHHPAEFTKKNIEVFKGQIKSLGFSYDWDREIATSDPEYYKWTQWIFTKLYDAGLAYVDEIPVNWCPELKACLLYTSPSPRDRQKSRMPSSA